MLFLVEQYPDSGFTWKMLGATLRAQGKESMFALQKVTQILPDDAEAHLNLGNVLRGLGQLESAVASYRQALEIKPDFAEAHCNLGVSLKDLGQLESAVASYRRSLEIKPDHAVAHYNLGVALQDLGQAADAATSYRLALKFQPNFVEAHSSLGNVLRDLGLLDDALACYRRVLEIKPNHAQIHFSLGATLQDLGQTTDAMTSYRRALELDPEFAEAHSGLGNALRDLGQLDDAVTSYRRALEIKPDFAEAHYNLGAALQDLVQLDDAAASYRRAVELKPDYVEANNYLGSVLMELGKMDEAEKFLSRAVELAPGEIRPLVTALSFIPYRQDDNRFNQLETVYARRKTLPTEEQIMLNFVMGKAMANIGQYDRAFKAYTEGNQLHYQEHPFDEAGEERFLEKSGSVFTADLFKQYSELAETLPAIQDERVPIFIVGMPRSGTTLIEQILASHSAIYGAGELNTLGVVAKNADSLLFNSQNRMDTLLALRKLGQTYLDQVWQLAPHARYISDKMPGNYYHLGLIHLMLPNAKIIHSMRDPMDTCFSCYTLKFTQGHEYSYDLRTLGRQYLRYTKWMRHWKDVLPSGWILDVRYEDNVVNPEQEARRLLEYLGLPWDPACLKFHENQRTVRTASVTQVRKPIYSSSVARWKPFENYLEPLLETIHSGQ